MRLTNKCLVCNSTENLNTTIKIKVQEQEVEVALCGMHEETSPKHARELIATKLIEFDELKKKMQEFGVSVGEQEAKPTSRPLQAPKPQIKRPVAAQKPLIIETTTDDSFVGESVRQEQSINTVAEITNTITNIKKKDSTKEVRIPRVIEAESQMIQRGGGAISIPKKIRTDDGGVTDIIIVETSDEDLQKRAKQMDPNTNPRAHSFKDGYNVKECPLCRSAGKLKNGQTCPKCKGSGYWS
jgi:transcription elongation factor Elf1